MAYRYITTRVIIALWALLSARIVQANIGEDYGYGPRSASLGGASTAWNFDGYASYNNPAGLPLINRSGTGFPDERFSFSYGIIYMNPSFLPINNVVQYNSYSAGTGAPTQLGNIDTSYKSTFGQMFGGAWRADPDFFNLTFGITLFFPFNQLAYLDSGATLQPEYVMYRDRTQQPDITFGAGIELASWFRAGMGLHVDYTLTTSTNTNLVQSPSASTAELSTTITPKVTPYFGLLATDSDEKSLGLVVRLPSSVTSTVNVNSNFQPTGALPTVPFAFVASDTIVYQPFSIQLGGMLKTSETTRTYGQVDYQAWSHFEAPYLLIANPNSGCGSSTNCGLLISGGPTLDAQYRDTFTPRIGEEISWGTTKLRLGYAYHPSIFKTTSAGIGNYLDPSKHMFSAGMGFVFQRFLGYHKPWNFDFSLDYQALITQQINKSPGDETGKTGTDSSGNPLQKVGGPGYQAGGHVFGGQVALTLGL